ncbi:TPA: hypothetical protein RS755_000708 [Mannheimia haemolytica]|nr:hypothetical protein [Mannheimia haemolytica]
MVSVDFKNNPLEFIFYGLFSEHTQTNIINGLQFYPKAGVAFRKDLRFRKRAVYQREIMVFYQLDKIDEPKKVTIIAFRLGRMKNPIRLDTVQNRRVVTEIFMNYPEKD